MTAKNTPNSEDTGLSKIFQVSNVAFPQYQPKKQINPITFLQKISLTQLPTAAQITEDFELRKRNENSNSQLENEPSDDEDDILIIEPPFEQVKDTISEESRLTFQDDTQKQGNNEKNVDETGNANLSDQNENNDASDKKSMSESNPMGENISEDEKNNNTNDQLNELSDDEKRQEKEEYLKGIDVNYYISESDEDVSDEENEQNYYRELELEEQIEEQEIEQFVKNIVKGGWRKKYSRNHLDADEQQELEGPTLFQSSKKATQVVEVDFEEFFQKKKDHEKDDEAEDERAYKAKILRKSFKIELENSQNCSTEPVVFEELQALERIQKTNVLTLDQEEVPPVDRLSLRRHRVRSSFISKNFQRPDAQHVSNSSGFHK